tara:strand:- start:118 stop:822 length:705 start_codon:yes stop_codon:yes gene_type:complete
MAFKMKNAALKKQVEVAACPRAAAKMQAESAMKKMHSPARKMETPAKAMDAPTKAMTKSPMEKELVGKQHNLPPELKAKIEAAPTKAMKSPMKEMKGKKELRKNMSIEGDIMTNTETGDTYNFKTGKNTKNRKSRAEVDPRTRKKLRRAGDKSPVEMKSPMEKDDKKKKSREATPDDIVKRGKGKFKKKYFVMVDNKKVSVNPAGDGRYMYKGELIPTSTKVQEGVTRKVGTSN